MKNTKYAVKYQLSNCHTRRIHDTMDSAIRDLINCQKTAKSWMQDNQSIYLVVIDGDSWRDLTEVEMDDFANRCFDLGSKD